MATPSPSSSRLRRPAAAGARTTVAAVESALLVPETAPPSSATSALPSCGRSAGLLASDADATLSSSGGASDRKSDTSGGGRSRCMAASARASVRLEREPRGEHPEQDHPERVDVARRRRGPARRLLGRDVRGGAENGSRLGQPRRPGRARDAEVGDLRPSAGVEQDVRRLQVTVDDAPLVGMSQPGRDLARYAAGVGVRERLAGRQPVLERAAGQVLEHQEPPSLGQSVVVDRADVDVREPAAARASRSKRAGSASAASSLTATVRSSSRSVAAQTSDMPPLPIRRSRRYRPAMTDSTTGVAYARRGGASDPRSGAGPRARAGASARRRARPAGRRRAAACSPRRQLPSSTCRRFPARRWTAMPSARRIRRGRCPSSPGSRQARRQGGRLRPGRRWGSRRVVSSPTAPTR